LFAFFLFVASFFILLAKTFIINELYLQSIAKSYHAYQIALLAEDYHKVFIVF